MRLKNPSATRCLSIIEIRFADTREENRSRNVVELFEENFQTGTFKLDAIQAWDQNLSQIYRVLAFNVREGRTCLLLQYREHL